MEKDIEYIDLLDEEGNELSFKVISFFKIDDLNSEYVVLTPADEEGDEAVVLKVEKDEDGSDNLINIEDEAEFAMVEEAYNLLMQED
ncbi:DUF1292 domain-containing protein [Clostridium sardiniense]|uniref:UPF0473 protein K5V21_08420 n=1 Tax=Clostridium sardiniense TaxID=29369 RepID=A0ABS7KXF5_CLOSR|nr:DUF1292 domain-containing protein [Clostridium sardiniense]MBM7835543.1 uncharacterized protein YrzB (UPF0473 family) [Clostridium sardiniense]MBY0755480.1 DUF1292 domain-containing protein [Clostridium sardiniense]MDQ0461529.1 uncharacterized protein YrzB (UPF0473 family) [Clostridium sardiniense]